MDKYEFNIKVEQIKKLVSKSDYDTAMKIADTIDWRRVRNTNLLSMVAMVYEKNEDYEEAKEILLLAFERAPIGKRLLYKLAELALKEGKIDEAEAYYREFSDLSPEDPRQQLLRYLILKAKGAPAQQLIHSLESYTGEELDERWLYELAELYSIAGMADRCIETCDKIMLMFGLGKYVDKAMELKIQYAPLTTYQMDLVENRDKYEAKLRAVEQEYSVGGRPVNVQEPEEDYEDGSDGDDQEREYSDAGYAGTRYPDYGDQNAEYQEPEYQNAEYQNAEYRQAEYQNTGYQDAEYQDAEYQDAEYQDAEYQDAEYQDAEYQGAEYQDTEYADAEDTGAGYSNEEYAKEPGYAPVYQDASYSDVNIQGNSMVGEELKARLREAEVQEKLAKELSRISDEDIPAEPVAVPDSQRTRILEDIRRVNRQPSGRMDSGMARAGVAGAGVAGTSAVSAGAAGIAGVAGIGAAGAEMAAAAAGRMAAGMPRPHGTVHMPKPVEKISPEPIIEEDTVEETPVMEAPQMEAPVMEAPQMAEERPASRRIQEVQKPDMPEEPLAIEDLEEDEGEEQKLLNHLMIEARTPEKGLQMAIEALKQIHRETGINNPVAKISGSKLSKRGVLSSALKLAGKDLVIEEAGDLSPEALDELNELMNRDTSGMIVVLIDNPKQMEALHGEHPVLASKFECIGSGEPELQPAAAPAPAAVPHLRIEEAPVYQEEPAEEEIDRYAYEQDEPVYEEESYEEEPYEEEEPKAEKAKKTSFWNRKKPVYEEMEPEDSYDDEFYEEEDGFTVRDDRGPGSNGEEMDIDEFAQYACKYANEIDCSITGKSMLALYERIEIMEEDSVPLTRENAEDLIEEAADRAEKPSFGKRIKGLFSSKYDKDGLLILKEEHFIY